MKTLIGVVFMATMLFSNPPKAHALFGRVAAEKERRQQAEQQLSEEQQRLDVQQRATIEQQQRATRWQIGAFVLSIAAVIALFLGTAIGSRGRDHANAGK